MTYSIGIDVGTSYTAAAVSRGEGETFADPEPVVLGTRSMATASVVFVGDDGRLLVGDAAERRAQTQPERVIREFKRRLGDSVPLIVGGWSHQPEDLAAIMVKWVVDRVADREGGPAAAIGVSHPASWGPYKLTLFRQALAHVGLPDVTLLSEPVAAAAHYASHTRIEPGSTIAVYDLGGGTFDAAVVRKTDQHKFELLGRPEGIERLGGVDFDEAVFAHIKHCAELPRLDMADQDTLASLTRLRRECTDAKEALSADTETTIPVLLPQKQTRVRLVRTEFEGMVRGALQDTVDALRQAIRSADVADEEINSVLLVGGSSRIPLVAQLISAEFARPVAIDADPKATIALGAARAAAATLPVASGAVDEASGEEHSPAVVATVAGADSAEGNDATVHHPYEQLLQLRGDAPKAASSSPFGRVPAAAVAALIAIVISAAAALAWTSTVDSSAPEAQAVEESPSAKTTTAAPIEDKMSTSGVSSTDGRTAVAAPVANVEKKPLKATKASQGVLGGRESSPSTTRKPSSPTSSAAATSQTPTSATSTPSSPSTNPTTDTPAPSPTTSTTPPQPDPTTPQPDPTTPQPDPTTPQPDPTTPQPDPTTPPPSIDPAGYPTTP